MLPPSPVARSSRLHPSAVPPETIAAGPPAAKNRLRPDSRVGSNRPPTLGPRLDRSQPRRGGEYTMKMPGLGQTILMVGTPAVILVGSLTTMAAKAATPTATPSAQAQPAAEPAEAAVETAEPALPGGGHAEAADQNAESSIRGSRVGTPLPRRTGRKIARFLSAFGARFRMLWRPENWAVRGSNSRHSACKADALPAELTARGD